MWSASLRSAMLLAFVLTASSLPHSKPDEAVGVYEHAIVETNANETAPLQNPKTDSKDPLTTTNHTSNVTNVTTTISPNAAPVSSGSDLKRPTADIARNTSFEGSLSSGTVDKQANRADTPAPVVVPGPEPASGQLSSGDSKDVILASSFGGDQKNNQSSSNPGEDSFFPSIPIIILLVIIVLLLALTLCAVYSGESSEYVIEHPEETDNSVSSSQDDEGFDTIEFEDSDAMVPYGGPAKPHQTALVLKSNNMLPYRNLTVVPQHDAVMQYRQSNDFFDSRDSKTQVFTNFYESVPEIEYRETLHLLG
ncbi:hypothetical protein L596_011015 [Steinernema carpocapsae]|uniref:SEA domain-containing protein n=1 Tax=Steinernema carpocapsae TaxID=34508 RepID=A0A4U5NTD1_STECR|nr:hypothetical protein L596_011015 [Steinernema carpocapsae]